MNSLLTDLGLALIQLLQPLLGALSPLLIGLILAWLLHPAVQWLIPRTGPISAIAVTYAGFFAILTLLLAGFVILITGALPSGSIRETADLVTIYFQEAFQEVSAFSAKYFPGLIPSAGDAREGIAQWITHRLTFESAASFVSALSGAAVSLLLGVAASVYLLKDRDYFLLLENRVLSMVLKQRTHGILCEVLEEINQIITAFLKGALVDSLIVAFLSSLFLSLLQVDFAVVIGIFCGILNVIPYFGPFIGMIPAVFAALAGGGLPLAAAAAAGLFLIQQIDSDFIYPRIVGSTTGLHPLFVLLSVSTLGSFFGLIGMLFAVPAAGILQVLIKYRLYWMKNE